jgi:hypothetical protein
MLEAVDEVAWDRLVQPSWNGPREIPHALRDLRDAATEEAATAAYHRVLYAVGNNHAGTYYPIALSVIPFLGELLLGGTSLVRETTLDVLIDLSVSFEPEAGFETIESAGRARPLAAAVREAIHDLGPLVAAVVSSDAASQRERDLGRELLSSLEDAPAG